MTDQPGVPTRMPAIVRAALLISVAWLALQELRAIFAPGWGEAWLFHRFVHSSCCSSQRAPV